MKTNISILLFLLWHFIFLPQPFAQIGGKQTIFDHLRQEGFLQVTMESDFKSLVKNKRKDEFQPATLHIARPDGTHQTWQTEIKARGNMRRTVCEIPPIKIKFNEEELASRGLDDRSTLKMVLVCRNGQSYEQMVLREYFAYQLYNIITDQSFRVQLAKINYKDIKGRGKGIEESFAFFIEHPKDLAERSRAEMLETQHFSSKLMNTDAGERFAMFQYMIGNTDWYFFNGHNVEVCGVPGTTDLTPLPYDFDYSGLVKTPYAVPLDKLGIVSVAERYYQGYCRTEEQTMQTIRLFLEKKEAIMQAANTFPYFDKFSRKYVSAYLEEFFDIIENPTAIKRRILEHCDKWPVK